MTQAIPVTVSPQTANHWRKRPVSNTWEHSVKRWHMQLSNPHTHRYSHSSNGQTRKDMEEWHWLPGHLQIAGRIYPHLRVWHFPSVTPVRQEIRSRSKNAPPNLIPGAQNQRLCKKQSRKSLWTERNHSSSGDGTVWPRHRAWPSGKALLKADAGGTVTQKMIMPEL